MQKGLKEIDEAAESIYECNMRTGLSREINEACVKIRFLAGALKSVESYRITGEQKAYLKTLKVKKK